MTDPLSKSFQLVGEWPKTWTNHGLKCIESGEWVYTIEGYAPDGWRHFVHVDTDSYHIESAKANTRAKALADIVTELLNQPTERVKINRMAPAPWPPPEDEP